VTSKLQVKDAEEIVNWYEKMPSHHFILEGKGSLARELCTYTQELEPEVGISSRAREVELIRVGMQSDARVQVREDGRAYFST